MSRSIKRAAIALAALAAMALGASALAGAATSSSTSTPTTTGQGSMSPPGQPNSGMPAPGTAAHEDAEKAVTGTDAEKAQAAAVKSVGSGTAGAVTTDFSGKGYETTVTKSDGTKVEVHLNSSFEVMTGPPGGHGPGGPGGPPPSNGSGGY